MLRQTKLLPLMVIQEPFVIDIAGQDVSRVRCLNKQWLLIIWEEASKSKIQEALEAAILGKVGTRQ